MNEQIPRHLQGPEIRLIKKPDPVADLKKELRDVFIGARKREKDMAARILQLEKTVARLEKESGHQ